MDEITLQQELRQVKRRRIEIRGTKAALDLEDLNLDDRQSTIEQLLRSTGNQINRTIEVLPSANQQKTTTVEPRYEDPVSAVTEAKNDIKEEIPRRNIATDIVTIDHDDGDIIILGQRRRRPPVLPISENKSSSLQSASHKKSPVNHKPENQKTRPSKIVVLKVRYDPHKPMARHTSELHQDESSPKTVHALRRHQTIFTPQPQTLPNSGALQRSQPVIQLNPHTSSRRSFRKSTLTNRDPSHDTINTSSPLQSSTSIISRPVSSFNIHPARPLEPLPQQEPCLCLGRDRNCRLCRGTPAVIAEGQWHHLLSPPNSQHPNNPSLSNTVEPRMTGQRPIARPKTYRIAAFEEMSDPERQELELRFCRRVVLELYRLIQNQEHAGPPELNWLFNLKARSEVCDTVLSEFKNAVQRRPVAREDDQGVWDGRVLVSICRDAEEFLAFARGLVDRVTGSHPGGCCRVGRECWGNGIRVWLDLQMTRCWNCIEACESEVNAGERKRVVDAWEVG